MTITAKVQIVATDTDKVLLDETMSAYRDACNYVSDYVFRTHDLKQSLRDIEPFSKIKMSGYNQPSRNLSMI